jgi:uncharacterized SAM-binding protein YcdF (DUF218 family)
VTAARAETTDQDRADAQAIWDYHQMHHPAQPCSAGIGLGSHDLGVATLAADLYHAGLFPVLVFTGANSPTTAARFPRGEAVHFAEHATALGVPATALIIEPEAVNTGQNIEFSRRALAAAGITASSVMLVSKPYMERRAYATARRVWPKVDAVCASERLSLDDYVKSIGDDRLVLDMLVGDLQRIIAYPALGFAVPQEVPPAVMTAYERLTARGYDSRLLKADARCPGSCARSTSRTSSPGCRPWPSCAPPTSGSSSMTCSSAAATTSTAATSPAALPCPPGGSRCPCTFRPAGPPSSGTPASPIPSSRRRVRGLLRQHFCRSPHRAAIWDLLTEAEAAVASCAKVAEVSERTTIALLNAIGWRGRIFRSSDIAARTGRSERLADLTMSVGATAYLCGTGGSSYLDPAPFTAQGLEVLFFSPQPRLASLPLDACRRATALADLAEAGPRALARHLDSHAAAWRNSLPVMPRPGPQAPAIAERAGTAPGGTLALTARA